MATGTRRTAKRPPRKAARGATTVGQGILQGLGEAVAYERGELADAKVTRVAVRTARKASVPPAATFDASRIIKLRGSLNLSQPVFAAALNVKPDTVRSWEQSRRTPDGAAARLLELAEEHPEWIQARVIEQPPRRAAKAGGTATQPDTTGRERPSVRGTMKR